MEVKFNINYNVQVKLTEDGIKHWIDYVNGELDSRIIPNNVLKQLTLTKEQIMSKQLPNGNWEFQLYELMRIFGECMHIGNNKLPFGTEIVMDVKLDRKNKIEVFLKNNS